MKRSLPFLALLWITLVAPRAHAEAFDSAAQFLTPPGSAPRLLAARPGGPLEVLEPGTLLAQRTIEREWGPSEDSVYVELDIPGLKSEALATSLSAIFPGSGQLYAQEGAGWLYAAIEVAGWGGWSVYRRDARHLRDQAAAVAGPPGDPASGWSVDRWVAASAGDPKSIELLYAGDREAFYQAIASDPRYASGWSDPNEQAAFRGLRIRSDQRIFRSRLFETGLWFNHVIAAIDALRSARFHNLPLRQNVGLRLGRPGSRALALALEARF